MLKLALIENGQIRRKATSIHNPHLSHFGALPENARRSRMAHITKQALIPIFSMIRKICVILYPFYHFFYLLDVLFAQLFFRSKCGKKGGKRTVKGLVYKLGGLKIIEFLFG